MGSIAGTINSVSNSLLSEINNYSKTSNPATATAVSNSAAAADTVDFSQVAQLFKDLRQLQTSNPTEFKQVASDAATQLKAAAGQTTDPQQSAFLNDLANKFQAAATSGNLSAFQSVSSTNGSNGLYSAHGHHHHHGGGGISTATANQLQSQSQNSTDTTTNT